jgi:thymidylate synthase
LAEIVWIMNRSNDAKIINFWNPSLSNYSGKDEKYHGAYGYRIGYEFGFDQLEAAYNALKNNPDTRQVVIQYYKSDIDFPTFEGRPRSSDIPCNVVSIIKIRDNKLDWTQIMRSNDVIRGLPYNIVQFSTLHELLAGWLEVELGNYTHFADSLHLYKSDLGKFSSSNQYDIANQDKLYMPKETSESIFASMYSRMKYIVENSNQLSELELERLSFLDSDSPSLNNMMQIIGAYVARKMSYLDLEKLLNKKCTNSIYLQLWNRWVTKT